jgi:multidrug resistance protein, MATE family
MIGSILRLGLPIILSQGILTLMVLCDRFILSLKNPIFAAAATTGGFTGISLSLFFVNFLAFGTSLIARRHGSGEKKSCFDIVHQTLFLSCLFSPLLLLLTLFGEKYFTMLGHSGVYKLAEVSYFKVILYSQIICLFRTCVENYYIGIQSAGCILKANIFGLISNAVFSYLFVLGPFSHLFEYGSGAAWGTFVSSLLSCFYLFFKYIKDNGISFEKFQFIQIFKSPDLAELSKQGTFIGMEKFVNSFCFVFFVNLFVVYGNEVSTSISTLFSWDQISYLPLLGIYSAVVSIFSNFLGENEIEKAKKSLYSSLKMTYFLMLAMALFFYLCADLLTGMFLKGAGNDFDTNKVYYYSGIFFKTTSLNVFATATSMLYKAALRSLGFSSWCFVASSITHAILCVMCHIGLYKFNLSPIHLWGLFLGLMSILGLIFVFKFHYEMRQLQSNTEAQST